MEWATYQLTTHSSSKSSSQLSQWGACPHQTFGPPSTHERREGMHKAKRQQASFVIGEAWHHPLQAQESTLPELLTKCPILLFPAQKQFALKITNKRKLAIYL